ncbi:MAG: hypothetical protein H5T86_13945 [Armatimonadetes bacterium]|nr:hypothetical protein [Armatimonadota bacterium]
MSRQKLSDKLFMYLWCRYAEGASEDQACEISGLSPELIRQHRARRSSQFVAAERQLAASIPPESLVSYARAAQLRILTSGSDSTAASVAARILDATAERESQPVGIRFIIQEADSATDYDEGCDVISIEDIISQVRNRHTQTASAQRPPTNPGSETKQLAAAKNTKPAAAKSVPPPVKKNAAPRRPKTARSEPAEEPETE